MNYLITVMVLLISGQVASAQGWVEGHVLDPATDKPVQFAHAENISRGTGTITTVEGFFRVQAKLGDTITFSSVGYQRLGWVVDEDWLQHNKTRYLPQDTTMLDEVVVNQIPPEAIFKQRILDYQPEDTSFWYHGMPEPKPYDNSPLSEKTVNNPLFAITHPTDFIYQKFSRSAKEKRAYQKITQQQFKKRRAYQKFSRDWVAEVTSLKGDELTDFIAYCNFSIEYLDKTPRYLILEEMLAKLSDFKKDGNS